MSTDIPLIVEALQSSTILGVQGGKVRKHEDWSKWIPASVIQACSIKQSADYNKFGLLNDTFGEEDHRTTEKLDKVCDDFANTFMFDEELALEQKGNGITEDDLVEKFALGVSMVTSLALAIHCPTVATAPLMLINGYKNPLAIAVDTEIQASLLWPHPLLLVVLPAPAVVVAVAAPVEEKKKSRQRSLMTTWVSTCLIRRSLRSFLITTYQTIYLVSDLM